MVQNMKTNKVEVKNLCKDFDGTKVLKNISFQIASGEFVSVMGQSGCGKSTLLYCVSGMDRATSGEILFDGRDILTLSDKESERLRLEHMGFVFQKANFLKNLSVADNILFPAFQLGKPERGEIRENARKMMERLGILPIANHDIRRVSGGQLQRAAICRAMINRPQILFCDEPTGALNTSSTREVMDIMSELSADSATTILLVTHDANVASRAERVIYLEDGQIKDIFSLGKFTKDSQKSREQQMKQWLEKMKF